MKARPECDLRYFSKASALYLSGKAAVPDELPRFELGCVSRPASVVIRYPLLLISGCSDILLVRKIDADVDVPHRVSVRCEGQDYIKIALGLRSLGCVSPSSPFGLRRAPRFFLRATRGCATRSPKGEAWWSQAGSNRRPRHCERRALPAELWPRRGRPKGMADNRRHLPSDEIPSQER